MINAALRLPLGLLPLLAVVALLGPSDRPHLPITQLPVALTSLPPHQRTNQPTNQLPVQPLTDTLTTDFPRSLTFTLDLDAPPQAGVLTYDLEGESCLEAVTQVPVQPDGARLRWKWQFSRSGSPPPGARIWWEWTVTDAAGDTFTTSRQHALLLDDRYTWRQVSAEGVDVFWARGDEVGPALLESATAALARLESELGIRLQRGATLVVYGSTAEMRDAVLFVQEWTGALAYTDFNVILMGVNRGNLESWGKPTVAHELAHLVIGQYGRSCVGGSRPTWLEEGLAVWAEGEPSETVRREIADGIAEDRFAPVRSLNGAFAADVEAAGSAYSQSYSLVAYLLETYGQERLQALILTLADGATYDEALETVYGFNTDGLEVAWRAAIGAPPRAIPPTPTPIDPALVPTAPPVAVLANVPTPPAAAATPRPAEPENGPSAGICAAAFLALVGLWSGSRAVSWPPGRWAGSRADHLTTRRSDDVTS